MTLMEICNSVMSYSRPYIYGGLPTAYYNRLPITTSCNNPKQLLQTTGPWPVDRKFKNKKFLIE